MNAFNLWGCGECRYECFLETISQLEDYNLVRSRNSYSTNYIHTSIHASIGNTS